MIVCPVCEHAQESGAACEVCGKRLAAGAAAIPAVAPVEGLEPTLHPAAAAPVERVAELEPTRHPAAEAAPEPVPDVEATAAPPVDVDAAPLADVERTGAAGIPDDGPTLLPMIVTCRYCRSPAMPGERICAQCGMRLPVLPEGERPPEGPASVRCTSCGALAAPGGRCPSCGGRIPAPQA